MRAKVTAGLLLMMFFLLGWAAYQFQVARSEPAITGAPLVIEINKGDSFKQITQKLVAKQANISPLWFKAIALSKGVVQKLKTGEYELAVGLTAPEILDLFVQGKTKQYAITFPEGWAFKDWLQALAHNQNVLHTLANVDAAGALQILSAQAKPVAGMPSTANMALEGLFFPDTYYFDKQTTDVALLLRAYDKMQQVLAQEWQQKLPALPIKTP